MKTPVFVIIKTPKENALVPNPTKMNLTEKRLKRKIYQKKKRSKQNHKDKKRKWKEKDIFNLPSPNSLIKNSAVFTVSSPSSEIPHSHNKFPFEFASDNLSLLVDSIGNIAVASFNTNYVGSKVEVI